MDTVMHNQILISFNYYISLFSVPTLLLHKMFLHLHHPIFLIILLRTPLIYPPIFSLFSFIFFLFLSPSFVSPFPSFLPLFIVPIFFSFNIRLFISYDLLSQIPSMLSISILMNIFLLLILYEIYTIMALNIHLPSLSPLLLYPS